MENSASKYAQVTTVNARDVVIGVDVDEVIP